MKFVSDEVDELAHGRAFAGKIQIADLQARRTLGVGRLELVSALSHGENQRGHFLGVAMHRQLEPFRQKRLEHLASSATLTSVADLVHRFANTVLYFGRAGRTLLHGVPSGPGSV